MPGFIGIAFRARPDAGHFELFYIRPGNSRSNDQAMRNHSVQYVSSPGYGWEKLRRQWPYIYKAYAVLQPEEWTHLKIDVHGRKAVLYLNESADPSLVVDGLKGEDLEGPIALWCWAGEEAYFSNLKVTNRTPEPIQNDGEVAGTAIECGMTTELQLELVTQRPVPGVHAETPAGQITFGFSPDLNAAMGDALDAMLTWLQASYRVDKATALAIASPVLDLRVTQVANQSWGVHALLPAGAIS